LPKTATGQKTSTKTPKASSNGAGDSIPTTHRENIDAYPVDVLAHFRFPNDSRWTPYLSGGVHYVSAPSNAFRTVYLQSLQPLPVTEFEQRQANRMSAELGAGASLRLTPRMGLQFDLTFRNRTAKASLAQNAITERRLKTLQTQAEQTIEAKKGEVQKGEAK